MITNSNTHSNHGQLPSAFVSLIELLSVPKLELSQLIAQLTYIKPESVNSLHDLADKIKECTIISDEELQNVIHTINVLGSKQFSRPIEDSVREIISNALDAQLRAHNECMPLEITIKKNCLVVTDHGDGFGYESLINYFVQGRTSNASQSMSPEKRMAKVTGRFGQGGMSSLYFLLYHTLSDASIIPTFKVENNVTTLNFLFSADDQQYEVSCAKAKDEINVQIEIRKIESENEKKISIKSQRINRALKIKLFDESGIINSNISQIDPSLMKVSTRYKIVSPLIETSVSNIIKSISDNFKFVTSSPIKLNGEFVNDFKQTDKQKSKENLSTKNVVSNSPAAEIATTSIERKNDLRTLQIEGGSLCYSPLASSKNRKGSLLICEGGKMIMEFPLTGNLVPEKVSINFDYLRLTQDRNTVDFKDPVGKKLVKKIIEAIWTALELTIREKSALLNSLNPILKKERFDLIDDLIECTSGPDHKILPDLTEFEHLEEIFLLDPSYLKKLNFPILYKNSSSRFYKISCSLPKPIIGCKFDETCNFFLDNQLFCAETNHYSYFNVTLINQWLKEKKYGIEIDPEQVFGIKKVIKTKEIPYKIEEIEKDYDYTDYINASDGDQIAESFTFEGLGIELSKSISKERQEAVIKFLGSVLKKNKQMKKVVRFFFDLLCKDEEIWEFCLKNNLLLPRILCNNCSASLLFYQAFLYLKKYPEEAVFYRVFYKNPIQTTSSEAKTIELGDYPEYYLKWKKLMDAAGISDAKSLSKYKIYYENLDPHLSLIEKAGGEKSNIIKYIGGMDDVPYLLSLPFEKLSIIFKFMRVFHEGYIRKIIFNRTSYYKILSLYDQIKITEKRNDWIYLYFVIKTIFQDESIIDINLEVLEEEIMTNANDPCEISKTTNLIKDICKTFTNVRKINYGQRTVCINFKKLNSKNPLIYNNERSAIPAFIEWATKIFTNLSQEEIKLSVESAFDLFDSDRTASINEVYLQWAESHHFILPQARPFFYAILLGKNVQFYSKDFNFPTLPSSAILLHHDPDVLHELKDETLADTRIKNALCQSVQEFDWTLEAIKNCIEAGAKNIDFKVYSGVAGEIIVEIKDDAGMESKNIKALKIPGVTTKNRGQDDPNYGWGFYTLLNKSKELYGTTSLDGVEGFNLHFKKSDEGMLFHGSPTEDCAKGTKFLLKMKVNDPTKELIKIMANVTNICRHYKGVCITFNDKVITDSLPKKTEVSHSENLVENGKVKGICEIKIGGSDEGLYRDNLRIGNVSEEYFSLLPKNFMDEMKNDGMRFTIFLPKVKQNMNRNHLINSSSYCSTIQRGVLAAAIKYFTHKCLKGNKSKSIPTDFWFDFRVDYKRPDGFLGSFIDAISKADWSHLSDRAEVEQQQQILSQLSAALTKPEMQGLSFPYHENSMNLGQFLDAICLATLQNNLSIKNESLKKLLADKRSFAQLLFFLPLSKGGPSLNDIRNSFKRHLIQGALLDSQETYSEKVFTMHPYSHLMKVKRCSENVRKELKLDSSYISLITLFTTSISERIGVIKTQDALPKLKLESCPFLESFFVKVAKKLLLRDVEVVFYSKSDGRMAYTVRNSNIINVNQSSPPFLQLVSLLKSYSENTPKIEDLEPDCIKMIVDWLVLLCHEITHQKENQDCHSTHDEVFHNQLCELLQEMLIVQGKENCLEIFHETFLSDEVLGKISEYGIAEDKPAYLHDTNVIKLANGTQGIVKGPIQKSIVQGIVTFLEKNYTPGIRYNRNKISDTIEGGNCSAMALDFASKYLKLRKNMMQSKNLSSITEDRFLLDLVDQICVLAKDYDLNQSEDSEIAQEFRNLQGAFNCIEVDKDQKNINCSSAKIQSMGNFFSLKCNYSSEEIKFDSDSCSTYDFFCNELDRLLYGIHVIRFIKPSENEKMEENGHTVILITEPGCNFFYDPNAGVESIRCETVPHLVQHLNRMQDRFKLENLSIHTLTEMFSDEEDERM